MVWKSRLCGDSANSTCELRIGGWFVIRNDTLLGKIFMKCNLPCYTHTHTLIFKVEVGRVGGGEGRDS